jgi:hypothetical protein
MSEKLRPGTLRSSCDACRAAKTACPRGEKVCVKCAKSQRNCTVEGVPWLEYWQQTDFPIEPEMGKKQFLAKNGRELDKFQMTRIWRQLSSCSSILAQSLSLDAIDWLVSDGYFQGLHYTISLICPNLVQKQQWLSHPLLTGAIVVSCFQRSSGECEIAPGRCKIEISDLEKLARVVLETAFLIVDIVATDEPSQHPLVPLPILMEAMLAIEVTHLFWGRTTYLPLYWKAYLIAFHIVNRWNLHQIDLYDPSLTSIPPPNAYLRHLWDECADSPFTTPLPIWRQTLRRYIWTLIVIDGIYSGYIDVYPRLCAQDVSYVRPPIPETEFAKGWTGDKSWDDWYMTPNGPLRDMTWCLLERGDPLREAGLQATFTNIVENEVALLSVFACMVGTGSGSAIHARPTPHVGFYPFLLSETNHAPMCDTLLRHPRLFWLDLLDDGFGHLPEPLTGMNLDQANVVVDWFGPKIASRFFIYMTRLMDFKLRLCAWTPQFSLVDALVGLQDHVEKMARETVGYASSIAPRYPPLILPVGTELHSTWLRLYPAATLHGVLADSISASQLLRLLLKVKDLDKSIRVGHSILSVAFRVALIHVSIVVELRQQVKADVDLLKSSADDARMHISFIKSIVDVTGDERMPRWVILLETWLNNVEGLRDADIREVISALVEDFR